MIVSVIFVMMSHYDPTGFCSESVRFHKEPTVLCSGSEVMKFCLSVSMIQFPYIAALCILLLFLLWTSELVCACLSGPQGLPMLPFNTDYEAIVKL